MAQSRKISPEVASKRATLGGLGKHRPHDAQAIEAARLALRLATAEEYVRRLVDALPPLSAEQLGRLAVLLRPDAA